MDKEGMEREGRNERWRLGKRDGDKKGMENRFHAEREGERESGREEDGVSGKMITNIYSQIYIYASWLTITEYVFHRFTFMVRSEFLGLVFISI